MMEAVYTPEQNDALREVVNVAIGRAADSLSRLLHSFVRLPIPRVRFVSTNEMRLLITDTVVDSSHLTVVRQAFLTHGEPGEALVLYGETQWGELGRRAGFDDDGPASQFGEEVLLDISNILVGACLRGIAEQLSHNLTFSAPSVLVRNGDLSSVFDPRRLQYKQWLLLDVNFQIDKLDFRCDLLFFWPERAIALVAAALNAILESFE